MSREYRNEEFATCSKQSKELKTEKDALREKGFPVQECKQLVEKWFSRERMEHLGELEKPVFLAVPSTTGENKLPKIFAQKLGKEFDGEAVTGWALPQHEERTAGKSGLGKIRDTPRYTVDVEAARKLQGRPLVLVDDAVTTGGSTRGLREALKEHGLQVAGVVSLAQSELRKVSERDIERISEKLGEPSMRNEVAGVLTGQLKHWANYIEVSLGKENENVRTEIRNYFTTEHQRMQRRGQTHDGANQGIGVGDGRVAESEPEAGKIQRTLRREGRGAVGDGAVISAESGGVRGGQDGAGNFAELTKKLDALRALPETGQKAAVRELVDGLGGSDRTKVPLKVIAERYVKGREGAAQLLATEFKKNREEIARNPALAKTRSRETGLGH